MRVHHLEIACQSLQQRLQSFVQCFGVSVLCRHLKEESVLLQLGPIYIVLREDKSLHRDSVENIALEVENTTEICQNVVSTLGEDYIISKGAILQKSRSPESFIDVALIRSPIGNVKHTLLTKQSSNEYTLPGFPSFKFNSCPSRLNQSKNTFTYSCSHNKLIVGIDHITFAVPQNTSFPFMEWYQKCFGFSRLLVSNEEENDGFIVKTQNMRGDRLGLRLTALEEHLCSELALSTTDSDDSDSMKLVFAESLHGQGPNQIDSFLQEHEGPGIQHIGLLTKDICQAALQWKNQGVEFLKPPIHYYQEVKKTLSILPTHIDTEKLQEHGILVDQEGELVDSSSSFLLQVFTKPIFERNTFFFELIQRHGAMGFGAGNIAALWRAVDAYLREEPGGRDSHE